MTQLLTESEAWTLLASAEIFDYGSEPEPYLSLRLVLDGRILRFRGLCHGIIQLHERCNMPTNVRESMLAAIAALPGWPGPYHYYWGFDPEDYEARKDFARHMAEQTKGR